MSTMKSFHKVLNTTSESTDSYVDALVTLTKISHAELSALASNLAWQDWGTEEIASTPA